MSRNRTTLGLLVFALALAVASGCGKKKAPGGAAGTEALPAAAVAEAQNLFATRCTPCHGPEGRGDGPASASLNPHPRNFHDKTWQTSVTDEHIEKIMQYGGAAVGKSAGMPANPDFQSKPDVVKALRAKVRSFGTN